MKIYLDDLLRWECGKNEGCINWVSSVGRMIKFEDNNGMIDNLKIVDYNNNRSIVFLQYKDVVKGIHSGNLLKGKITSLVNNLWVNHRELCIKLGISKEVAEEYMSGSAKKIKWKCKDCGEEIKKRVDGLRYIKNNPCKLCGDGYSYPEKVMYNILTQLGEDFIMQYAPKYLKRTEKGKTSQKKSDFFIQDKKIVIETDGEMGHEGGRVHKKSIKTIAEAIEVDKWKDEQHLKNGIKTIRIDCFKSDIEYIKQSVLNSELIKIFDFSVVDWYKVEKFALSGLKLKVIEAWNIKKDWETTTDIAKKLRVSNTTVINYLKQGNRCGLCVYDPKEEMSKTGKRSPKKWSKSIVLVEKDGSCDINKVLTATAWAKELGISEATISNILNTGKGYNAKTKKNKKHLHGIKFYELDVYLQLQK